MTRDAQYSPMVVPAIRRVHQQLDDRLADFSRPQRDGLHPLSLAAFREQYRVDAFAPAVFLGAKGSVSERGLAFVFGRDGKDLAANDDDRQRRRWASGAAPQSLTRSLVCSGLDHAHKQGVPGAVEVVAKASLVGCAAGSAAVAGALLAFLRGKHQDTRLIMALFGAYGALFGLSVAAVGPLVGAAVGLAHGNLAHRFCTDPDTVARPELDTALAWAVQPGLAALAVGHQVTRVYVNVSAATGFLVRASLVVGAIMMGACIYAPVRLVATLGTRVSQMGAYYTLLSGSLLTGSISPKIGEQLHAIAHQLGSPTLYSAVEGRTKMLPPAVLSPCHLGSTRLH